MKVLITGGLGQLGHELQGTIPPGWDIIALDRRAQSGVSLDITDSSAFCACLDETQPELIINAAAYTKVDHAEASPEAAFAVNAEGAANIAQAAIDRGIRLIHISTDFVFDGAKRTPYLPEDLTAPVSVYGASKLKGEQKVVELCGDQALIIRSAWIYGARGNNFVLTMLRLMKERSEVKVVADQMGTPTWARSLARFIWAAAARPESGGIYHWTDAGEASWYDFAVAIQGEALALGLLPQPALVTPIDTKDYPTPAKRPVYSVLDKTSAIRDFSVSPQHWRTELRHMLQDITNSGLSG